MTSRIFVDVRGDGAVVANRLRLMGFAIEAFVPRQINKRQCELGRKIVQNHSSQDGTRCLLSEDDELFQSHTRVSLGLSNDRLGNEELARLWKT